MKIYHYSQTTGEYISESFADESPLEPGVFLIPAYATDIAPPDVSSNQYAAFENGEWLVKNIPQPLLEEVKAQKQNELWIACNKTILAGFHSSASGSDILYGFDEMDQSNLTQQLVMIANSMVTEPIYWKGKGETQMLPYTIEQFKQLSSDGQNHKVGHMMRFYSLKDQTIAATTKEEVDAIVW